MFCFRDIWIRQRLNESDLYILKQLIMDQGQKYGMEQISLSSKCFIKALDR